MLYGGERTFTQGAGKGLLDSLYCAAHYSGCPAKDACRKVGIRTETPCAKTWFDSDTSVKDG
jgi:hypothetical protein